MKSQITGRWGSVPSLIFGVIIWLSLGGFAFAQALNTDVVPVLEGLDPVMLVQGKEVQGNLKISVTRGTYQYLFASEENKASFAKDPARYEIQLGGACARMGAPVMGNPDLYSVYQSRIYIFGSGDCKKRFDATPAKYLESENGAQPKIAFTADALRNGAVLIERAVAAMGGAAVIDGLASYQEKSTALQTRREGDVEVRTNLMISFPDHIRLDQEMPDYMNPAIKRQVGFVLNGGEAFAITPNGLRPLPDAPRVEQERELKRRPLAILRARKDPSFKAAALSMGSGELEQVTVVLDGVVYILSIEPSSGRILSISYRRRGQGGEFGLVSKAFSDFRTVAGVTLPFKVTATFNDQPWKEQSANIASIAINGKIDPVLFERPKTARTQ
jgi:YHS domain-containing protein